MTDFRPRGRTFGILGLGRSGLASARALLARGARLRGFDENPKLSLGAGSAPFPVFLGEFPERFWEGLDAIIVSPGVPLDKLTRACQANIPVLGEIELGWRLFPTDAGPILGVTGTNGKSTTTALLGAALRERWPKTFVGGNLGIPLTEAYADPSSPGRPWHVLELSSFQLEAMGAVPCFGAALLNIAPDHLDRYPSAGAYSGAKARIFAGQPAAGFAVVNASDAEVLRLSQRTAARRFAFASDPEALQGGGFAGTCVAVDGGFEVRVEQTQHFRLKNRSLRGKHNIANAMAASTMATLAGANTQEIQAALDTFPGLAHRLEFVGIIDGVEWVNDSKATNVDASVVALEALASRVWLIAGGKGKGASYAPLVAAGKGKVQGVLTVGADAAEIARAFAETTPVYACESVDRAVARAHAMARAGDTVLLSPACASYDQFAHFEERGDAFKALVHALPGGASGVSGK